MWATINPLVVESMYTDLTTGHELLIQIGGSREGRGKSGNVGLGC